MLFDQCLWCFFIFRCSLLSLPNSMKRLPIKCGNVKFVLCDIPYPTICYKLYRVITLHNLQKTSYVTDGQDRSHRRNFTTGLSSSYKNFTKINKLDFNSLRVKVCVRF